MDPLLLILTVVLTSLFFSRRFTIPSSFRWIFVVLSSMVLYYFEILICNGYTIAKVAMLILSISLGLVLLRKFQPMPKKDLDRKSIIESLAVFGLVFVLFCFPLIVNTQNIANPSLKPSIDTNRAFQFASYGTDNLAHMNIIQYNAIKGKVSYFDKHDNIGKVALQSNTYPQLFHVNAAALYSGGQAISEILNLNIADYKVLVFSYLFLIIVCISLFASLLWSAARHYCSTLKKRLNLFSEGVLISLGISVTLFYHFAMAMRSGFASQICVDLFILAVLIYPIVAKDRETNFANLLLAGLLVMGIGNTWSPYSIFAIAVFGFYVAFSKNYFHKHVYAIAYKVLFIGIVAVMTFSQLISMIFISRMSVVDSSLLTGAFYPISKIGLLAVAVTLIGSSFFAIVNLRIAKHMKLYEIVQSMYLPFFMFAAYVILFCAYQEYKLNKIDYYGEKFLWTLTGVSVFFGIAFVTRLVDFVSNKKKMRSISFILRSFMLVLPLFVISLLLSTVFRLNATQFAGQSGKRIDAIASFVSKEGLKTEILVYSGTSNPRDFVNQRIVALIRMRNTKATAEQSRLLLPENTSASRSDILENISFYKPPYVISVDGCKVIRETAYIENTKTTFLAVDDTGKITKCE